jgi:hypothetical protein
MENILDYNIEIKAIDYWNKSFIGETHQDNVGRTLPNDQTEFNQHCRQIYNYKNKQKKILFSTLGLKQRPDEQFVSRTYI